MSNKPKPHPHAELIKAWADGAKIQYRIPDKTNWEDCNSKPEWYEFHEYRIKPEEPTNEPWKPKAGEKYFVISDTGDIAEIVKSICDISERRSSFGNCFRTREEAEAAAKRVKAVMKGEVVSKEEHECYVERRRISTKQSHDLECELYDKITTLEHENKALKIRNENLHKAKESLIAKKLELDGKPLTDGEKALIRAIRKTYKISEVYPYGKTRIAVAQNDSVKIHTGHIAFRTLGTETEDVAVIAALKQIKAEQEASND